MGYGRPICGICRRFAKTELIDKDTQRVIFVCKVHGEITPYVEFLKKI